MNKQDLDMSFRKANEETRKVWKESGVVKTLKWYTAGDELDCGLCKRMNGVVVGIDKLFPIKTAEGKDVYVPQDLHEDCRCYLRPEEISAEDDSNKIIRKKKSSLKSIFKKSLKLWSKI